MADKITKEQRSKNMSKIKGKDTSIEIQVRKYLYHHGFRYRKNYKELPGKPDIFIFKYNTVIFINGCFWHHHNCRNGVYPKSNSTYWVKKINRNVENDYKNYKLLNQMGYKVLVVWECELKENFELRMEVLLDEIITDFHEEIDDD